jgi:DNA-binding MarR family transcriptional regulator
VNSWTQTRAARDRRGELHAGAVRAHHEPAAVEVQQRARRPAGAQLDRRPAAERHLGRGEPGGVPRLRPGFELRPQFSNAAADFRAAHGVTLGEVQLLGIIGRTGNARVDDIAREIDIRTGTASKAVDRVEAADWVRRTPNPHDRRSSWLSLTDAGGEVLAAATPAFEAAVQELTAGALDAAELRARGRARQAARGAVRRPAVTASQQGGLPMRGSRRQRCMQRCTLVL